MSIGNILSIPAQSSLPRDPVPDVRELPANCARKSYNSSRDEWYYGLKLHAVVVRRPGLLPLPLALMASGAAQHDLPAAKHILEEHLPLRHGRLYADKAYINADWAESLEKGRALTLLTPRKRANGDTLISGDTFSTFVSSIRQPIECFFNWLNRLTSIQSASAVRSLSGLPPLSLLFYSTLDSHL